MENLDLKVKEILEGNGLDFEIKKVPLVGKQLVTSVSEGGDIVDDVNLIHSPYYGLLNTKSGNFINTVKEGYTVSQNAEVVELVLRGMQGFGELSVSKAGSINDGSPDACI